MGEFDEDLFYTPDFLRGLLVLKIPKPNDTRWNSVFYCIQRVYVLHQAILRYMITPGVEVDWQLTPATME